MKRHKRHKVNSQNNNLTLGLILLSIGIIMLLRRMGIFFPDWIVSWPMIFIVLGLVILVKHQFQSGFGFVMLLFGTFFLLKREFLLPVGIDQYIIPMGLILVGAYLILAKRRTNNNWMEWKEKNSIHYPGTNPTEKAPFTNQGSGFTSDGGEIISSQALFCGVQKRVLSKSFKGGKISTYFGGTEIDLRQADLTEEAYLDVEVAFGGIKLIVPPHWDLQIDITNVFAGIEDKRVYPQAIPDPAKVLRIKGTVIFGGLEIKSF